jgi:ornithine cyclodeaminase/alanine dehydrogenase-like protein (mu-crystallin family)
VLVYSQPTGELIAMLDASEVTRWRTAATTAVAGEMLAPDGSTVLGLVGTGFEAEGHLRLFAELWPLEEVAVYSRSAARRDAFAARMSTELGTNVRAVDSPTAAIAAGPVSVLATKSTEPVVDGDDFPSGAVVLSIGSTRPDLRELDHATMRRGAILLVDDAVQVCRESGDIMDALASGALHSEHVVPMAAVDSAPVPTVDGRDLLLFKSVGTAVHDLALALAVLDAARKSGRGRDLGELTQLKPFADTIAALPGSSA